MEVRKQFQIKLSERFAGLKNANDSKDINRAWENIKENTKITAKQTICLYGRKQHKLWFDERCSQFLGQRKQAQMQWLQNPNQSNLDNLNNATHETSRHFRNKKREYLRAKFNELETNGKNKNIRELYRGNSDFKKGYQSRTNIVKDEKGDLVTDSHSILDRCLFDIFLCLLLSVMCM
jgi:hypothetical protein